MPEGDTREGPEKPRSLGGRTVSVTYAGRELELIEEYAELTGMTLEEAADRLAREGLAERVRRKLGKKRSAAVLRFHRARSGEEPRGPK